MDQHVMEIAEFRAEPGVDDRTLVAAAKGLDVWLRDQAGFVWRRLAKCEDGSWVDVLEWTSLQAAQAAASSIMSAPSAAPMMQLIAKGAKMRHSYIHLAP